MHRRAWLSGGNWNYGTKAGVFNSNGNNGRENLNANIGFRSATSALLWQGRMLQTHGSASSTPAGEGIGSLGRRRSEIRRKKNTKCRAPRKLCKSAVKDWAEWKSTLAFSMSLSDSKRTMTDICWRDAKSGTGRKFSPIQLTLKRTLSTASTI